MRYLIIIFIMLSLSLLQAGIARCQIVEEEIGPGPQPGLCECRHPRRREMSRRDNDDVHARIRRNQQAAGVRQDKKRDRRAAGAKAAWKNYTANPPFQDQQPHPEGLQKKSLSIWSLLIVFFTSCDLHFGHFIASDFLPERQLWETTASKTVPHFEHSNS